MTKPRTPKIVPTRKAPKTEQPTGFHERIHEVPRSAYGAKVNRRAADRLRGGYLWVYASDIESLELPEDGPPALLPVADSRGLLLGTALYSPSSQIALRMVSRSGLDEAAWLQLLAERLRAAIARRKSMLDEQNNACRLCFSEADELPGVVADKYGEGDLRARAARRTGAGGDSGTARSAGAGIGRAGGAWFGGVVCCECLGAAGRERNFLRG
jgi:23S rRNA (cytosine1962-C5)-methyltransferase